MYISDLTLYLFLREKLKFSDNIARQYVKELVLKEGELTAVKIGNTVEETTQVDHKGKSQFEDMQARIEKGFTQLIIVIISLMVAFAGIAVAIAKF